MRSSEVDQGVPPEAIFLEQRSTDTYQNVTFVHDILREHGWQSVLLVSSPYHMRRALLVWHKAAPGIRVIPTPPLRSQFYDHVRGASFEQIKAVVQPLPGVNGDDALRASIMEHVQTRLGKYKWPRSIDFMDELPREPTGKLLKRKLRDPYWEGRDRAI